MTPGDKLRLEACVPALEAEGLLREYAGRLGPDEARELTLIATGSESLAEAAWTRAAEDEMRRRQQEQQPGG